MVRSYWNLIAGLFEDSLEWALLFLRTKQEPRACEGWARAGMKPPWAPDGFIYVSQRVSAGNRGHLKLGNWGELMKGLFTQMWARCRKSTIVLWGQEAWEGITCLCVKKRWERTVRTQRETCIENWLKELWSWVQDTVNLQQPSRGQAGNK